MKGLSEEGQALTRELWKVRDRFGGRERRALEILDRIAERREPMAVLDVVAFLFGAGTRVVEEAARVVGVLLGAVSNSELVELDRYLRGHCWWFPDSWRKATPSDMDRLDRLGGGGVAVLAVCCSHPNGYVRERALRLLSRERSGFELRFLLLRANDWVEPIREVACQAILGRLIAGYARPFVECLDLVHRLEQATREDHGRLVREVAELITSPDTADALIAGLVAEDRGVQRPAYRIALESRLAPQAIARGLDVDDSLIRLWCARAAQNVLDGDELRRVAGRLRCDPFMPVRREGCARSSTGSRSEPSAS